MFGDNASGVALWLLGVGGTAGIIGYHVGALRERRRAHGMPSPSGGDPDKIDIAGVLRWPPCPVCGASHSESGITMLDVVRGTSKRFDCTRCKANMRPALMASDVGRMLARRLERAKRIEKEAEAYNAAVKEVERESA